MTSPTPKPRWYQFSLRSLILLVASVAVLCSIGVCTDWSIPIGIASTGVIGGIVGTIVAGTRGGFLRGALYGVLYSAIALILCALCGGFHWLCGSVWRSLAVLGLGSLLGGGLGGYGARPRPKAARKSEG